MRTASLGGTGVAWRPGTTGLAALLPGLHGLALTYPEVGASRGPLPGGYRHLDRRRVVGHGERAFEALAHGLLTWALHRRAGLLVAADGPATAPGGDVAQALRVGPVALLAPCRVVYVTDEPARRGFAYGTLPGHPETGEEAFAAELGDRGEVTLVLTSFSRPGTAASRLGAPVARAGQAAVLARYVRAARALAAGT